MVHDQRFETYVHQEMSGLVNGDLARYEQIEVHLLPEDFRKKRAN